MSHLAPAPDRDELEDRGGTPDNRYKQTIRNGKAVFYEGVGPAPCNTQTVKLPAYGKKRGLGCNNGGKKMSTRFNVSITRK